MYYCAWICITSEDFEWETSMYIDLFIATEPSAGLERFLACSSVILSAKAKEFIRVVMCPQRQESCSV